MKQCIVTVFFLAGLLARGHAQRLAVTVFAGTSNYQGDLQPRRFTFNQAHPAAGLGLLYSITEKLYARAGITAGRLSADDRKNNRNTLRNLNFTTPLLDVQLGGEYHLLSLYEHSITPYVFGGIAFFHFNPMATDSLGNKVALRPLSTEGQGFYAGRKPYRTGQFAIPFGAGLKMALSDRLQIGIEAGLRKTFTDYIDDVSTTYVDRDLLLAARGPQAVELAFRGDELKQGLSYPADGAQRGGARYKDWYYFSGITLSWLPGPGRSRGGKTGTGCPAGIY